MPSKAVIFIVTQPWWAIFKISFVVIFTKKTHESFLKSQIEPCPIHAFSPLTADVDICQHYCGYPCFGPNPPCRSGVALK